MTEISKTDKLPPEHALLVQQSLLGRLNKWDWLFAAAIVLVAVLAQMWVSHHMDGYEQAILWFSAVSTILLGWFFKPLRWFVPLSIALAYGAVGIAMGTRFLLTQESPVPEVTKGEYLRASTDGIAERMP